MLTLWALALTFMPVKADAATNYVWNSVDGMTYGNVNNYNPYYNQYNYPTQPATTYNNGPTYSPPTQAYNYNANYTTPTVYSNNPTVNKSSTTAKKTTTKTVAKTTTTPTGNLNGYMLVPIPNNTTSTAQVTSNDPLVASAGALTANVLFGSNTFIPSGLLGWILLAILILFIIILVRRIFGNTARYMRVPLKHA